MKLLITGTGSGLGKHLHETLGGAVWQRSDASPSEDRPDVIIHSAWPARPPPTADGLPEYLESTLELTRQLTERPHRKFVFISTAEVYPISGHPGTEDHSIELASVRNFYSYCKLMAEALVHTRAKDSLILRVVGLLGPTARPNSLIRILRGEPGALTLTGQSRFYYILHRCVSAFVRMAIEKDLKGVYNVCSSESVSLEEVARRFGRDVRWGNFTYDIGHVDNGKIAAIFPALKKTSLEVIDEFVRLSGNAG